MTIFWSPRAIRHLGHVRRRIARDSPAAAGRLAARILEAAELLTMQPHLGRAGRVVGTRELVVAGTPYIVPYRIVGDEVRLIAVFHGRQKWPERF